MDARGDVPATAEGGIRGGIWLDSGENRERKKSHKRARQLVYTSSIIAGMPFVKGF
jgi:hypothetical protein